MTAAVPGGRSGFQDEATYRHTDPIAQLAPGLREVESSFERYRARKLLEVYLPAKEDRVLDLASGKGVYTLLVAPRVREVVGLGGEEAGVSRFRDRARELSTANVRFVRADPAATGLDEESFDVAVAADVLERSGPERTAELLDECERVLKRGGRLVVWTPHGGHLLEKLRSRRGNPDERPSLEYKTLEELRRMLLDRGFSIQKAYYVESHVPVLRKVERTLMGSLPFLRRRIAVLARKR